MTDHTTRLVLPRDLVAIVTGGATGVGRAVCEHLARAGAAAVVVNYSRSADDAARTADAVRALGADALAERADVTHAGQVDTLIDTALRRFGRIDLLVNNAAITRLIPFDQPDAVTDDDWRSIFEVNLHGAFRCTMAATDALRRARGSVVNITSVSASRAAGTSIPYAVSKAALLHLTRCLATSLAPDIRVNAVSPGAIKTRWMADLLGESMASARHHADAMATPLARIATPDDIASAVLALAMQPLVTGHELVVDGGRSLLY